MTGDASRESIGVALAPVRARYAAWLGLDEDGVVLDRAEPPGCVRAIQLVLRLERGEPPSWHAALALAAAGCAALCLDPRSEPGGDWYADVRAYSRGHIRKVARRARGAAWDGTAGLPGLTLAHAGTQVRVLVPGLVDDLDRRVAKLQVGGTDVPADAPTPDVARAGAGRVPPGVPRLRVAVPAGLPLTAGKLMAQTGHAGMIAAAFLGGEDPSELAAWRDAGCPTRVDRADEPTWLDLRRRVADPATAWRADRLVAVRDAGFTEVAPGTVTVVARLGS